MAFAAVSGEVIRFSQNPAVAGIETESIENSQRPLQRFHDSYTVIAVVDSIRLPWRRGVERSVATSGDVCFAVPGDLTVMSEAAAPQTLVSVMISRALMEQLSEGMRVSRRPPAWRSGQRTDHGLCGKLAALHTHLSDAGALVDARAGASEVLRLLFARCIERRASPAAQGPLSGVRRARGYIEDNYAHNITLDQIADAAGVSRFHLTRIFAKEFGVTPRAYLLHVRLARAKALLATGAPLQQVAMDTGFSDQSHFTRHFRNSYGMTPMRYLGFVRRGG